MADQLESWVIQAEDGETFPLYIGDNGVEVTFQVVGDVRGTGADRRGLNIRARRQRRAWGHRMDGWFVEFEGAWYGPLSRAGALDELWNWLREQFPDCSVERMGHA